ncbi:hypothetical protein, partial [Streptomyces sp. NRRL WC-3549]|uniref:hypothetical protein n=1 Tax=Streptomyces sp. NRRL WC-3549 TaxID=1463925 RepID=UPI001F1946A9
PAAPDPGSRRRYRDQRSDEWTETTMSENTKPAADDNNETPEVEAHSVLDLQETSVHEVVAPGNCVSLVSVVENAK